MALDAIVGRVLCGESGITNMELTTRDLGMKTEEIVTKHDYRLHAVDGLPNGMQATIIEESGWFCAYLMNVPIEATARRHRSLAAALDELRSYDTR